ncbi:PAS domain S-box protein, partial [bacterium]|nr:PAS domain S-box protein [bacterium]
MNLIALIDLAGVLVLLVSIVLMLKSWKTLVQRAEKGLIVLLIALGALLVNTGNFLEWAGITSSMDPLEDYLQILIVALWGFVFVTIFYERAQEAAWKSESRFKNLLEHTADAVFLHDREGQILDVNTQACLSLGYARDELLALKIRDFDISEFASEDELQEFWEGVHAGVRSTTQGLHQRKDGSTFPVEVRVGHIPSKEQALFVAIARDITQQVEKDRKLQKTAERYRLLADNASDVIWTMDFGFNYIYISPSVERQRGLTVEEALAMPLDKAVTKESMDRTRNIFAEEMTRDGLEGVDLKRARTLELEYFHKDGHIIIGEVTANLLRDENGKAVGIIGTTRD